MGTEHDDLDLLIRESAGPPPDPGLSRRAVRAALAGPLQRRERRDARARVGRTLALTALLVVGLAGQLGSDDFDIAVTSFTKDGREFTRYRQGLRGEEIVTTESSPGGGMSAETAADLLDAKAATVPIPVEISGFRLGSVEDLSLLCEYELSTGEFIASTVKLKGRHARTPKALQEWMGSDPKARGRLVLSVVEVALSRAPDFTTPMYASGLTWVVSGWRVKLPGREEIIYFRGLRADGVRPQTAD